MTVFLAVLGAIEAIAKAIPVLNDLLNKWIAEQAAKRYAEMKSENREAIKKAVATHDQRPIETVIGSPSSGEPSGVPGSIFVPGPPPRS